MRRGLFLVVGCAGLAACVGELGDAPGGADPPLQPLVCGVAAQPGPAPIRRMTRFEYDNTVRDLLGDTTHPAADFGAEEEALGFNNNAANLVTSSALVEKYMVAAEGIAARATEAMSSVVPCDPAAIGEEACAQQFIASFGKRAFRRPLAEDESELLFSVYQQGRADADFRAGIEMVIEVALQSPAFLYRVEFGVTPRPGEATVRLDGWETASRLSYFLWGSMPDADLFAAAESGKLATKEDIAAQARRMLDEPRAREATGDFHQQWLHYDRIASVGKDAALFPAWSSSVGQLMRAETSAFIDHVVFEEGGDLHALLTAPYSFMNKDLAAFYGVPGPAGDGFERVDLDPTQRAGILTTGTLLTINAHSNQTSPVHRGKLVRERFFCAQMPPPPKNVDITVPEPKPGSTARERFAEHSQNQACKGCHELMDGIGFGFENYDAVGRYRAEEDGQAIDASGSIAASDVDGTFDGAVEMSKKLASSHQVERCYTTQWFRYAYGRGESPEDACTLAALGDQFADTGGDIKELIVALTQTDAFLYRKAGGAP
jgi:Protein of unknown function (DUF1592)/Protein of unknown function (DUF1588)/Protein of unknown function (DUF1587)/Protein of unknown function (DUF1595)/Protein of unknown function (DUF1585)